MYNKCNMHRGRRSTTESGVPSYGIAPCRVKREADYEAPTCGAPSLAMVYSVSQSWRLINDGYEGFERGTIFDELNKPFFGDKCKRGGGCK